MSYTPVTLTFATATPGVVWTVLLKRSGDVVTAEITPATSFPLAPQNVPNLFTPVGNSAMTFYSSSDSADPKLYILQISEPPASAQKQISLVAVSDTTHAPMTVSWAADHDASGLSGLEALLSSLPGYSILTDGMKQAALDASLVPDAAGLWPAEPGYVPTYDIYYAAITLVGFLQAQPVVRQSSSEGTSVAVDAPNWDALLGYYRSLSRIIAAQGGTLLQVLDTPDGPHVRRTDMRGRYGDADVDTDLA